MQRIGTELISQKKAEVAAVGEDRGQLLGRDILSVLVKDNMQESEAQKLSEEEILARKYLVAATRLGPLLTGMSSEIATFIIAGHETASTTLAWTLYALSKNHAIQTKLRNEVLAFPNANPSPDELNSLPYLDCVIKESLRRYSPAPVLDRTALQDMVIPLGEPVVDRHGKAVQELLCVRPPALAECIVLTP